MFMHKLKALGIPNLHINKYEKKRYNKLVREQNKYRNNIFFTNNNSYRVSHIAACDGIKSTCQSILGYT